MKNTLFFLALLGLCACHTSKLNSQKQINPKKTQYKIEPYVKPTGEAKDATKNMKLNLYNQSNMINLPYDTIPAYPAICNAGTTIARTIDGLGYRYYWATENLRPEDLAYTISDDSRPALETLEHLYGLAVTIKNSASSEPNIRPYPELDMTWEELRKETLMAIKAASDTFKTLSDDDVAEVKMIFQRGERSSDFPVWNLLNGPLADAIYHVGQIVAYRRASGNPLDPTVNVFMGKNRQPK